MLCFLQKTWMDGWMGGLIEKKRKEKRKELFYWLPEGKINMYLNTMKRQNEEHLNSPESK